MTIRQHFSFAVNGFHNNLLIARLESIKFFNRPAEQFTGCFFTHIYLTINLLIFQQWDIISLKFCLSATRTRNSAEQASLFVKHLQFRPDIQETVREHRVNTRFTPTCNPEAFVGGWHRLPLPNILLRQTRLDAILHHISGITRAPFFIIHHSFLRNGVRQKFSL